MEKLFFSFYRFFLIPWIGFILGFVSRLQPQKKWSHFYFDRREPHFRKKRDWPSYERPIWIHAASGEIEYARPLLRLLKENFPQTPILVTSTSRSSQGILENIDEIDCWGPSPWDSIRQTQKFLQRWQPRVLLIARTDLWPEILFQCEKQKIPRILFSATFHFSSESSWMEKFKLFNLKKLTKIFTVSEQDCAHLKIRGLKNVSVGGDTRYDQVFHRLSHPKKLKEELKPDADQPVFIAGSTWPEDEKQFVPALSDLQFRTIIAPHEIDETHLTSLENLLSQHHLSSQRYSQAVSWPPSTVLIIDQIGILAELYTWANLAFVGGSFKKQVHSVMEPLAAGLYTLVGPFHSNNREAIDFQSVQVGGLSLVTQVTNSNELRDFLQKFKGLSSIQNKEAVQSVVQKRKGSSLALLNYLTNLLRAN